MKSPHLSQSVSQIYHLLCWHFAERMTDRSLSSFLRPPTLLLTQGLACCITYSYDSGHNLMQLLGFFFPPKARGFFPQFSKYFQDSYLLNVHHKPTNCTTHGGRGGGSLAAKSCLPLLRPHGLQGPCQPRSCQAPLSMGFPRQEHWRDLPFPSPGNLPDPGTEPMSPALAGGFFTTEPPGKPTWWRQRQMRILTVQGERGLTRKSIV